MDQCRGIARAHAINHRHSLPWPDQILPSVDFTADLPVVQIRRTVMRRALVATAIPPRVALAMGNEPLLLRYTIGLFGYGLIGCAVTDAESCLLRLAEQPHGLLVCSDSLDNGDVLSLTATVKERHPAMKVIVISTGANVDPALVQAAWIDGLVAERDMTFHSGALQAAVLAALGGNHFRSASMRQQPVPEPVNELSPRDYQILEGLADGLTDREIAERLMISPNTAKSYTKRLLQNIGARNRLHALVIALRQGLIRLR
jgi:DNA-binding NarL/FixJ family response regulator